MPSRLVPLPTVLADLALAKRGLVLMRGRDYWRIEEAASQARREAASGPKEAKDFLSRAAFFWTTDESGKVLLMKDEGGGPVIFAVEPGALSDVPG